MAVEKSLPPKTRAINCSDWSSHSFAVKQNPDSVRGSVIPLNAAPDPHLPKSRLDREVGQQLEK